MRGARAPRRPALRMLLATVLVMAALGCEPDDLQPPDDPVTDPREEEQGAAGYPEEREMTAASR